MILRSLQGLVGVWFLAGLLISGAVEATPPARNQTELELLGVSADTAYIMSRSLIQPGSYYQEIKQVGFVQLGLNKPVVQSRDVFEEVRNQNPDTGRWSSEIIQDTSFNRTAYADTESFSRRERNVVWREQGLYRASRNEQELLITEAGVRDYLQKWSRVDKQDLENITFRTVRAVYETERHLLVELKFNSTYEGSTHQRVGMVPVTRSP